MEPLARWVVGHYRLGAALEQEAAQTVTVVGGVGDQAAKVGLGEAERSRHLGEKNIHNLAFDLEY